MDLPLRGCSNRAHGDPTRFQMRLMARVDFDMTFVEPTARAYVRIKELKNVRGDCISSTHHRELRRDAAFI